MSSVRTVASPNAPACCGVAQRVYRHTVNHDGVPDKGIIEDMLHAGIPLAPPAGVASLLVRLDLPEQSVRHEQDWEDTAMSYGFLCREGG